MATPRPAVADQIPMARARSRSAVKTLREDRQGARHQGGGAHPHDGAGGGEALRAAREGRQRRTGPEHHEAAHEDPLPSHAVAQGPKGEQKSGEDDGIGVDDPLQLSRCGVQAANDRRQRHVENGAVQTDEQQGDAENRQGGPAPPTAGLGDARPVGGGGQ